MLNDAQWLHILAAEADHLVTVEVGLALKESEEFREFLSRAFRSDGFSDVSGMWNKQRTMIIDEVIEKHLVPVGVKHVREWLRDEVEEQLASRCSTELERVSIFDSHSEPMLTYFWCSVSMLRPSDPKNSPKATFRPYSLFRGVKVTLNEMPFSQSSWTRRDIFENTPNSTISWTLMLVLTLPTSSLDENPTS